MGPAGQVDDATLVGLVCEALLYPLDEECDDLVDGGLILGDGAHVEVGLHGAADRVVIGCIGAGEEVGDGMAVCDRGRDSVVVGLARGQSKLGHRTAFLETARSSLL